MKLRAVLIKKETSQIVVRFNLGDVPDRSPLAMEYLLCETERLPLAGPPVRIMPLEILLAALKDQAQIAPKPNFINVAGAVQAAVNASCWRFDSEVGIMEVK